MAMIETELKFRAKPTDAVPPLPGGLCVLDETESNLVTVYWDDVDRTLLHWGISLRHRTSDDGADDGWTLKLPAAPSRSGTSRYELTADEPAGAPPSHLACVVASLVRSQDLAPVVTLTTRRRIRTLGRAGGPALVAVSDDAVRSERPDGVVREFREFEAELLGGATSDVLATFERSWRRAGLKPSGASKLAVALDDRPAAERQCRRDGTHAEFVSAFIDAGLRQLVANEQLWRADPASSEAVHQARVATRRLRSNLKTFRPLLRSDAADALRQELAWIGALLGAVRDAQVRAGRLRDAADNEGVLRDGLPPIEAIALGQADNAARNLLSAFDGARYRGLVGELRCAVGEPPARHPRQRARPAVRKAVRRRWKRIRLDVDAMGDDPAERELHDVRKKIKALRYGMQEVTALGVRSPGLVKALGGLQDQLGDRHDAVEIRTWLAKNRTRFHDDAAFLAGQLDQAFAAAADRSRNGWRSRWADVVDRRIR